MNNGFGNKKLQSYVCLYTVIALREVDRMCYVLTQRLCNRCCFRVENVLPAIVWSQVSSITLSWTSEASLTDLRNLIDGCPGLGKPGHFGGSENSVLNRLGAQLGVRPHEHSNANLRTLRLTKKEEGEEAGLFLLSSLADLGFVGLQRLYLEKCACGDLGELKGQMLRCIFIDGGRIDGMQ